MKKTRVVYLIRRAVGGMQTHVLDLAASLPKDRYEVRVVAPPSDRLKQQLSFLKIPFLETEMTDDLTPLADLRTAWKCRAIFKRYRPHIVHIHGNKVALVGRIAAWRLPIPVQIVTVHNLLRYQFKPGLKQILSAKVDRYLAKQTDLIISVSKDLSRHLISRERLPSGKIRVVYNGIDWQELEVAPEEDKKAKENLGFSPGETVVGMIARLAPQKSPQTFVAAAKNLENHPRLKFLLVGDGPLNAEVRAQVERLGLSERLRMTGFRGDIPQILAAIDIFVLSSRWEGIPYVLEEAMAAAKPIVATAVGGVPELITSGENGLLVPPGDSEALSRAILKLLTDPVLRNKLAERARETIKRNFSKEKMVQETVSIYEQILAQKENQFKLV